MANWIPLHEALADVRALAQTPAFDPEPGTEGNSLFFRHLPADEYHADRETLSCSMLKPLLLSPAHFMASLVAPQKDSPAKDFGSLVHLLLLEPHLASRELAVYPGQGSARNEEFKEFRGRNAHRMVVDEPTFARAFRLASKVADTRYKGRPIGRFIEEAMCEGSIYFTEPVTGLRLRIRVDALHPDISFDLKTTRHATPSAFARDAVELGYDLQAYMYGLGRCLYEGTSRKPFVFITAESGQPGSVCTFEAGSSFIENGGAKFRACLAAYKACSETGYWPDLSCHTSLEITPWQQFSPQQEWRMELEDA